MSMQIHKSEPRVALITTPVRSFASRYNALRASGLQDT